MSRALLALVALLALAGCGSSSKGSPGPNGNTAPSDRLVDLTAKPPLVNALDIDPTTGDFLLTTNRGFYRIDPKTKKDTKVTGTIAAGSKSSTVGTFLFVLATGNGQELIGSGHPDTKTLPQFLGFIRSPDGGKTFTEKFTPRGLIIDFAVSPGDQNQIFAATEEQIFRSEDGGDSWRGVRNDAGTRMAWPAQGTFYKATKDGVVSVSSDDGDTWKDLGKLPGEPYKIKPVDEKHLYVALSDGTIMETTDGGTSFKEAFRP